MIPSLSLLLLATFALGLCASEVDEAGAALERSGFTFEDGGQRQALVAMLVGQAAEPDFDRDSLVAWVDTNLQGMHGPARSAAIRHLYSLAAEEMRAILTVHLYGDPSAGEIRSAQLSLLRASLEAPSRLRDANFRALRARAIQDGISPEALEAGALQQAAIEYAVGNVLRADPGQRARIARQACAEYGIDAQVLAAEAAAVSADPRLDAEGIAVGDPAQIALARSVVLGPEIVERIASLIDSGEDPRRWQGLRALGRGFTPQGDAWLWDIAQRPGDAASIAIEVLRERRAFDRAALRTVLDGDRLDAESINAFVNAGLASDRDGALGFCLDLLRHGKADTLDAATRRSLSSARGSMAYEFWSEVMRAERVPQALRAEALQALPWHSGQAGFSELVVGAIEQGHVGAGAADALFDSLPRSFWVSRSDALLAEAERRGLAQDVIEGMRARAQGHAQGLHLQPMPPMDRD